MKIYGMWVKCGTFFDFNFHKAISKFRFTFRHSKFDIRCLLDLFPRALAWVSAFTNQSHQFVLTFIIYAFLCQLGGAYYLAMLGHAGIFFGLMYIICGVNYYKHYVRVLVQSNFIIQGCLFFGMLVSNKIALVHFWLFTFHITEFFVIIVLFVLGYLFYSSPFFPGVIEYFQTVVVLGLCLFYAIFYSLIAVVGILLLLHVCNDFELIILLLSVIYGYLNYIILVKVSSFKKLLNYFIYIYLNYLVISYILTGTSVLLPLEIFIIHLFLLLIANSQCASDDGFSWRDTLIFIKFINKLYYLLLIIVHIIGFSYMLLHIQFCIPVTYENTLFLLLQFSLLFLYVRIFFKLVLADKFIFLSWKNLPRVYINESFIHKHYYFILGFVFCYFFYQLYATIWSWTVLDYDLTWDTFEYRKKIEYKPKPWVPMKAVELSFNKPVQPAIPSEIKIKARKIIPYQRRAIAGLYSSRFMKYVDHFLLNTSYQEGLEAFRANVYRYGPFVKKKFVYRWWNEKVRAWDYMSWLGMKIGIAVRGNVFAYSYHNVTTDAMLRLIRRGTYTFPNDLIRPLYDLYLLRESGFSEDISIKSYIKCILREWTARKTLHTRAMFTYWVPEKRFIPFKHFLTVNRYFQMFYELSFVRKSGMSLELCKFLVDLFELKIKRYGVRFEQYINVIDKMYTQLNHTVDIISLVDKNWWKQSKNAPWWLTCQRHPVQCSAELINYCWSQKALPPEYQEFYSHINTRLNREKKSRRCLFNYPFTHDKLLQRWVPLRSIPPKSTGTMIYEFFERLFTGSTPKRKRKKFNK